MKQSKPHSVAAIVGSMMMCYRHLQLGINSFAQANGNWHIWFCHHTEDYVEYIQRTGIKYLILGPVGDLAKARQAISLVSHTVGVCGFHHQKGLTGLPEVKVDDYRVGVLGAQHFLEKKFEHFGYVGAIDAVWSTERFRGFSDELRKSNRTPSLFEQEWQSPSLTSDVPTNRASSLIEWIRQQKKPLALMVCNDLRAAEITQACREYAIHVPDEVAILGVDNDDLSCALSWPPLSSVIIPWQRLGFFAADLLQRKIDRRSVKPGNYRVAPTSIAERQSTDAIAITDPEVRKVIQYIRTHIHQPISVDELLKLVPLTRRTLERRFRAVLGKTPLEEIRYAQLARAKSLLSTTQLPLEKVAKGSGFSDATWFSKAFKDLCGETPAQYRRRQTQSYLDHRVELEVRNS